MSKVTVICDRCHKEVPGIDAGGHSAGFYNVENSYWSKFAYTGETKICDQCMWEHPIYIKLYGKHT